MLGYDFNHKLHRCERGVVMVFFAILLPLLFGFMGLSIDVGLAYVEHGKVQDIADSAALAGAAHLSDSNRDDAIKAAVKAYVEANGIALQDDDLLKKESNSWETKESVPVSRQAVVAYGVVAVTNSEGTPVDRVRVRITKRVPVVFMSIIEGIADSFTVSAKAAAEGGGEEPVVSIGGQKIMCGPFSQLNNKANSLKMDSSYEFSIYAAHSGVEFDKLNGTGPVFANSYTGTIANGREFVPNNRDHYDSEIEKKKAEEAKALYEAKKTEYAEKLNSHLNNINDYKNGVDNKRYIGEAHWNGALNKMVVKSNIKPDDKEIELYVDATNLYVLSDSLLRNVDFIKNLVVSKSDRSICIINTRKMRYGNIYSNITLDLEGKQNVFDGLVYSKGEIYIMGDNNSMWANPVNSDFRFFCNDTFYLGGGHKISSEFKLMEEVGPELYVMTGNTTYSGPHRNGVDSSWHLFFGKYQNDSDSDEDNSVSGEGSVTTGKLRLVE